MDGKDGVGSNERTIFWSRVAICLFKRLNQVYNMCPFETVCQKYGLAIFGFLMLKMTLPF